MRILGIDPGFAITGWAIVDFSDKGTLKVVDFGVISTEKEKTLSERLCEIYSDLGNIIDEFKPQYAGLETLLFYNNAKTAIKVGEARGVVMLALEQKNVPIYEFTPPQVKSAVTGYGKAGKKQVQENIMRICDLKTLPKPDDAADAIAIAICCYGNININDAINLKT